MAIARDASSSGGTATNTLTVSHTCTGSNLLLLVDLHDQGADSVTGVTYNGVAMTQINKRIDGSGNNGYLYTYGLLNPATGAHNVVASRSGTVFSLVGVNVSYTGVSQSGLPDATATNGVTGTSITTNITTVADNAWIHTFVWGDRPTASTRAVLVLASSGDTNNIAFDTNGVITPAGATSTTVNTTTSSVNCSILTSFAPFAVPDLNITVNDTVTITESVVLEVVDNINVNDTITITESVTMEKESNINVNDAISITEGVVMEVVSDISVSESISITESVVIERVSDISVNDTVTITELITMDNSALGDISVFEAITITESVTMDNPVLGDISVSEAITITESVNLEIRYDLSVSDVVVISEVITVDPPNLGDISVSDSITITETVTITRIVANLGIAHMRGRDDSYPLGMDRT